MRNLKKLLAVIVAVTTLLTFAIPAFAADAAPAAPAASKIASDLGVLKGDTADGVTAAYLAKGTTRLQAAILQLRLLGKEAEAYAETATENFADANLVTWADGKALLAYLKKNPDLGWVGTDGKFDPNGLCTAQMLYKVLLESLGYKTGTDFQYADAIKFAGTKGLTGLAAMTNLTNDNVATGLVEALKAKTSDGAKTLAQKLVDNNIITDAAAVTAGLVVAAKALDVKAAVALNSKIVEVTLNTAAIAKDIAAAGALTVKDAAAKDVAVSKIEFAPWATDSKDLLVTLAADTTAGTIYTLTAGTVSKTFGGISADTAKPTVSKIESTDYNQVTITFSEPVMLGGTVAFAKSYGDKAALASTTIAYSGSTKITIATADQASSTLYAATIKGFKDLAGNTMDDDTAKTFVGTAKSTDNLKTGSAWDNNAEEALVQFNLKVDTTTIDPKNFKVEEAYGAKTVMTVTAARIATTDDKASDNTTALSSADAAKTVVLSITGLKDSTLYKVTVSNLKSTVGTAMDGTTNNITFVGKAKPTTVFKFNGTPASGSNTTVTVYFERKVDKATAETVANYAITEAYGNKATLAVTKAELQSNGTDVKLTVATMSNVLYKLVVTNLKDIYGNAIDTANNSTTFVGKAVAAKITKITTAVVDTTGTILSLTFDQSVGTSLTDVSHYSISDSVGYPTKAYADDASPANPAIVKLVIPKTTDGKVYTITIKGLENADGVAMDAAGFTATFVGKGNAATLPAIQAVMALNAQTLKIYFDRDVTDATVSGATKIWNSNALIANVLKISTDGGTTYTDLGAYKTTLANAYVYQDSTDKNALIVVTDKANAFASAGSTASDKTYKLQGTATTLINPTNSAATVLQFAYNDTAASDVTVDNIMALNNSTIRLYFNQPIAAPVATFAKVAKASGDTFATGTNLTLSNPIEVSGTNKSTWDFKLSAAMTVNGSYYLIIDPAIVLADGQLHNIANTKTAKDEDSSAASVQQKREFAGNTTAPSKISNIAVMMTDKRTIQVYYPEAMDSTSATDITKYVINSANDGAVGTQLATQPVFKADISSDKTMVTLHLGANIATASKYYMVIASSITTATTTNAVDAAKTAMTGAVASGVVTEFAPSTTDCAAPSIASVALDDDLMGLTITMNTAVAFDASNGAALAMDAAPLGTLTDAEFVSSTTVTDTTAFSKADFDATFTVHGLLVGDTTDSDLTTVAPAGATPIRDAGGKKFHVQFARQFLPSSNGYVQLKNADATVYMFNISKVSVDKTADAKTAFGVLATALYDTTAPVVVTGLTGAGAGVTIAANGSATITFSKPLSSATQAAVQTAITAGNTGTGTIGYAWNTAGNVLTISETGKANTLILAAAANITANITGTNGFTTNAAVLVTK